MKITLGEWILRVTHLMASAVQNVVFQHCNTFSGRLFSLMRSLFQQFPFLNKTGESTEEVFENWKKYKYSVPVYGAILLNQMLEKVRIINIH